MRISTHQTSAQRIAIPCTPHGAPARPVCSAPFHWGPIMPWLQASSMPAHGTLHAGCCLHPTPCTPTRTPPLCCRQNGRRNGCIHTQWCALCTQCVRIPMGPIMPWLQASGMQAHKTWRASYKQRCLHATPCCVQVELSHGQLESSLTRSLAVGRRWEMGAIQSSQSLHSLTHLLQASGMQAHGTRHATCCLHRQPYPLLVGRPECWCSPHHAT
jgi:hypothetical protein